MLRQAFREIERARPTDIMFEVIIKLGAKARVHLGCVISLLDLENKRHEGLGDKGPAIGTKVTAQIGLLVFKHDGFYGSVVASRSSASRTA